MKIAGVVRTSFGTVEGYSQYPYIRQSPIFLLLTKNLYYTINSNMATFHHSETDSQALYLSGTYSHKTGARPPSCNTPQEPTKYHLNLKCFYSRKYFGRLRLFTHLSVVVKMKST